MYLLADIGGSKTRISVTKDLENFETPIVYETPQDYATAIDKIAESIRKLTSEKIIFGIIGVTGTLNKDGNKLVASPHLEQWIDQNLREDLEKITESNIKLENDTALVGLGEAVYGAGKNDNIVAYITVSTGVGGVKVESQTIDNKFAAFEPGHQIIDQIDGQYLTLENLTAGSALQKTYGKDPNQIEDPNIWDSVNRNLAVGLNNTILHWSPDIIVLGGGLIIYDKVDVEQTAKYLKEIIKIKSLLPPVKKSELGDFGGLYGGMHYLKSSL